MDSLVPRFAMHTASPGATELIGELLRLPGERLSRLLSGDAQQALLIVKAAAELGIRKAQLLLGRMLLQGTGGPRDEPMAYRWFRRAAEAGDAEACNMLGRCLENGWGVPRDSARAVLCYRRAASLGDSWAQYNLGHLYLNGEGVCRDPIRAFHWYDASARQGHARAMNLVGRCYEQGWGVSADPDEAASWYRASAEAGYFRGQFNHAAVLMACGRCPEALAWLRRAAAQAPLASRSLIVRTSLERWGILLTGI